jgi:DNA-binding MarR family transcriptional regulator
MQYLASSSKRPNTGPADPDVGALEAMCRVIVGMAWSSAHQAPAGVTFTQFRALLALHELGSVACSRLASALEVNASSITRVADVLERQGYLTRGKHPGNRAVVTLSLTATGCAVVEDVLARRRAALAAVLDRLPAEHRATLADGARRFTATAAPDSTTGGSWPL